MIVPMGFLMIVALLPIIGVEAWVLAARLGIGIGPALAVSGAANALSTIIGLPANWLVGGIVGITAKPSLWRLGGAGKKLFGYILGNVFWLLSGKDRNIRWIMPSAQLLLLIPFFFLSWWIEFLVVSKTLDVAYADRISQAVFFANLASYGLLAFVPTFFLIRSRKTLLAAIHHARDEASPEPLPAVEQLSSIQEANTMVQPADHVPPDSH
jgi:hypothetical protein